jgi:hypothetical protein
MRKVWYSIVNAALAGLIIYALGAAFFARADCPDCYKDYTPPLGGLSVRISGDWNDSSGNTNGNMWNAVYGYHSGGVNINGALESWNAAQNNEPNTGSQGILQNFYLDQSKADSTTGSNLPTVIIKKGSVRTGCAKTNLNGPPYVITLPPEIANLPPEWIAATIMHELGHVLGLEEGTGACTGTIMNGCNKSHEPKTKAISYNDVDKARQSGDQNTRANCKAEAHKSPAIEPHQGYIEPPTIYYRPTCYYYYEAVDYYHYCECAQSGCQCSSGSYRGLMYVGTVYYLTDIFCY